jgi:hypothetical protein
VKIASCIFDVHSICENVKVTSQIILIARRRDELAGENRRADLLNKFRCRNELIRKVLESGLP